MCSWWPDPFTVFAPQRCSFSLTSFCEGHTWKESYNPKDITSDTHFRTHSKSFQQSLRPQVLEKQLHFLSTPGTRSWEFIWPGHVPHPAEFLWNHPRTCSWWISKPPKPYHKVWICLPVISSIILADRHGVACSSLPHLQQHQEKQGHAPLTCQLIWFMQELTEEMQSKIPNKVCYLTISPQAVLAVKTGLTIGAQAGFQTWLTFPFAL